MADSVEQVVQALQKRWRINHHTAVHLLRLIGHVGGRTTSGGRTPAENRRVGGARNSDHLWGGAFDHVPPRGSWDRATLFLNTDRCGPQCRGPRIVIDEIDHLHWSDRR